MRPIDARRSSKPTVLKVEAPKLKLDRAVLAQVAVCVVPSMGIVFLGSPSKGAAWLYAVMLVMLARFALVRDRLGFMALIVSLFPALLMLRAFSFYNSVSMLLAAGIILWFVASPKETLEAWKDPRWTGLFILGGLYWLSSYLWTGYYASNLRVLELVFTAASIYLLAKHRDYLATSLIGLSISVFAVGLAFMPRGGGDRWGHEAIDGYILGNPITFGIPLALIFLLTIADNGKWLLLEDRRTWRLGLGLVSGAFLLLSTSRGSWAIVVVNVVVLLLIGKRQRGMLLASVALLVVVSLAMMATQRGEFLSEFYDKTFSDDRSMAQKSSGRSDQWEIFPQVFKESPIWGFGPGSGKEVYGQFSTVAENDIGLRGEIAWHSLYLQVGVEAGLIGLIGLTLLLAPLLFRGFTHWRLHGSSAPLIGVIGYMVIGLSVSALDAVSGLFLGIGFLSAKASVAHRFRWEPRDAERDVHVPLRNRAPAVSPLTRREPSGW